MVDLVSAVTQPIKAVTQPLAQLLGGGSAQTPAAAASVPVGGPSTDASAKIAQAQQSLAGDQQTFLKLLTAQLRNQDPLSPLDPNQFTQQLVVMTGVQQQILTNQLLQQLVAGKSGVGDPVGMIGKQVTATTPSALLSDGKADWLYATDAPASKVTVQVLDELGRVVFEKDEVNAAAGEHAFTWDGKDLQGRQRPDGVYTLKVTASGAQGAAVGSRVYQRGSAMALEVVDGQTMISLNGLRIPLSSVVAVAAAPVVTPPPADETSA